MDISFVIPCYCSEKNLESVITEIHGAMERRKGFEYEIILVNDNSRDNTEGLIKKLASEDSRILGINFSKNFGQPSALMAGFRASTGEYVMTSDDDGQTPVEMVWDFYDKIQEGFDIVCAKYTERAQKSKFRRFGTRVNEFMLYHMIQKPKNVGVASFFMAKKFVIEEMIRYDNPYPYIAGLLLRSSSRIGNLEMQQRSRITGHSGYTLKKLVNLWVNGFTAFSLKPLRIGTALGFVSAFIGFVILIVILIRKILVPTVQAGYTSQIGVTLLMGGLILCVLGIIGEYVGRIYMCINKEPQYIIRNTTREGTGEDRKENNEKDI
ncbi:glycosyltransferase [Clostridium sp. AF19-22AC]|jgi:glycosyltransferase involved in cell wall biosynthesis|uniref:glycosyltransferase family 2 protein n=1 Tax=Clostridia TaxID=186801 RepID=UPI000E51DDB3|nr:MULTISPECIES: glycosyltransferase family 2 protein [Clostridia]RHR31843.1 glycosyltransferase [Clostridium sp. AF19-22AC]